MCVAMMPTAHVYYSPLSLSSYPVGVQGMRMHKSDDASG